MDFKISIKNSLHFDMNTAPIGQLINRFMNCMERKRLYCFGDATSLLKDIYPTIQVCNIDDKTGFSDISDESFVIVDCSNIIDKSFVFELIDVIANKDIDGMLYFECAEELWDELADYNGRIVELGRFSPDIGCIFMFGNTIYPDHNRLDIPDAFRVLAIIHSYNEEDIIETTIKYLLSQEIDLYLIDNWSTDKTYEIMRKYRELYPERIMLERFPADGDTGVFDMYHLMERSEQLATELNYDWFIHYDTDEMRISFWEDFNLRETFYVIDRLGYNLVENTVIDFRIVDKDSPNIFMEDTWFAFRHDANALPQVKSWKKTTKIDLKTVAGHSTNIRNPRVFPLKILNRHYPYRSIDQAMKKVFRDRMDRSKAEYDEKGWHGHYFYIKDSNDFIYDREELILWDWNTVERYYIPLYTGIGIRMDGYKSISLKAEIKEIIHNKKVVVYGAGNRGKKLFGQIASEAFVVAWVDKSWEFMPSICSEMIQSPDVIGNMEYDFVIITIADVYARSEINSFLDKLHVDDWKRIIA